MVVDIKQVMKASTLPVQLENDDYFISFNGVGGDAHEPFTIPGRDFTKTVRKPYDELVCASLIIGAYHGILTFSSDGHPNDDGWVNAVKLLERTHPHIPATRIVISNIGWRMGHVSTIIRMRVYVLEYSLFDSSCRNGRSCCFIFFLLFIT
eukprot:GHVR01034276.1.p1 GENE.GHVR01034276.1~~GHVR01034276.1.p1  ORF type:complete len:151 (+),score=15.47 GHVR01034276.1:537-989(+)